MKKHFAVIGLGRFGSEVARVLAENKQDVIAIDKDEKRVKALADHVTLALELDATDEKALREAGIENVDVAIVSIGENTEASILVVMILKELGIKNIVSKAHSELYGRVLSQLGVKRVVHPERDMAQKVAYSLITPELLELIELSPEYSIVEIPAPEFLWDKVVMDAGLRTEHGMTLIAIKSKQGEITEKESWNINPLPTEVIRKDDVLVVLGANEDIEKFSEA